MSCETSFSKRLGILFYLLTPSLGALTFFTLSITRILNLTVGNEGCLPSEQLPLVRTVVIIKPVWT